MCISIARRNPDVDLRLPGIFLVIYLIIACTGIYAGKVPLFRAIFGSGTFTQKVFAETIATLNAGGDYHFSEAYKLENSVAFYSQLGGNACWFKRYHTDELADSMAREIADFRQSVFRYGNFVGFCLRGDTAGLADAVREILKKQGQWKEEKP